nr:MAG TPA: hypothetical protein [Bacteriophage sp.]
MQLLPSCYDLRAVLSCVISPGRGSALWRSVLLFLWLLYH